MASRSRSASAIDGTRRTFRGRSGPTDRNLNKHQARRRKDPSKGGDKRGDESNNAANNPVELSQDESNGVGRKPTGIKGLDGALYASMQEGEATKVTPASTDEVEPSELPSHQEIQHLNRRIRNVRESIQLSTAAISTPAVWQQNVLNTVQNCVSECVSIVTHYNENELDADESRSTVLELFQLVQLALQSGPLRGAKPGYFKRCGAAVAGQALAFLDETCPDDVVQTIGFTERQIDAIQKWRTNARKAIENDKPPSKSALKKQNRSKKSR